MDIENLRLTKVERIMAIQQGYLQHRHPNTEPGMIADAQIAKALWGLVDECTQLKCDPHECCNVGVLRQALEAAGVPRPEELPMQHA